jgi:parvulin-like peptidyl-prolyl isomerase
MNMWNKNILIGLLAVSASMVGAAFGDEAKDRAAVAKLLPTAKVTLSQGLAAAESKGQPISGKFEVDEGHFQLSVYTAHGAALPEVVVDYTTGKIAKAEA